MTERRFFVPPEDLTEDLAIIRGPEHHHLSRVLRLQTGDEVFLFDGAGRGRRGVIESIARQETRVKVAGRDERQVEPAFRLTLAQGIPHHDKMDLIIQKATEIGVATIAPIVAQRSVVRPELRDRWGRLERWRRVARESARQSGRLLVPQVDEPVHWAEFAARPAAGPLQDRFLLCPPGSAVAPDPPRLAAAATGAVVAVGPEGGWTEEEMALGVERGFRPIVLGSRVLRTETAGIVAVALLLHLAGELGPPPEPRPR